MVGKEQETHEEKQQKTCGGVEELVFICKRRPYRELQKAISVISNGALQQFSLSRHSLKWAQPRLFLTVNKRQSDCV